jgi:hypothetical protein
MAKYENLSLKLTQGISLDDIDNRARELGLNRSQFVNLALTGMINFDLSIWKKIQEYSKSLNLPEWIIIQNMIIKIFAEREAEVESSSKPIILDEFVQTSNGMLTGQALYDHIKKQYKNKDYIWD